MEKELPIGWIAVELEKIVDLKGGFAFKSNEYCENDGGIPIIRMGNITKDFQMRYNWNKQPFFPKTRIKEVEK